MEGQLKLSELNFLIKEALQDAFPEPVWVIAEIGELKANRTGHCYLELVEKDEDTDTIISRSKATIWSWQYRFIQPYFESITGQALTNGIKVLLSVSVEFHEIYGISLNVKDIDPNYTLGDMARKRQETINKLINDGIFEMNKELSMPEIPSRIAIISSPTAAGYEDFMNQLQTNNRNYFFATKLFAATMQGNDAPASIISALDEINTQEDQFDVVVMIRGGGSQLDLICFDNYELASHVAQFPLPVLTGIGHERDESIVDMVAHTRLKTPTAVAEFLIQCFDNVALYLNTLEDNFIIAVKNLLAFRRDQLAQASRLFKPLVTQRLGQIIHNQQQLANKIRTATEKTITGRAHHLNIITKELESATNKIIQKKKHQLMSYSSEIIYASRLKFKEQNYELEKRKHHANNALTSYLHKKKKQVEWLDKTILLVDPINILKRGFSITLKNNTVVKNAATLTEGETIETIFYEGKITSKISK